MVVKVEIAPQWQKMTPEHAIRCVRTGVVEDAVGSLVQHLLFSGEVTYASFVELLGKEGSGDVAEQLDVAAGEVFRGQVEQTERELASFDDDASSDNFNGSHLRAWAAKLGGNVVLQECYNQLLVDKAENYRASAPLHKGALENVRRAHLMAKAVAEAFDWLNGSELKAFVAFREQTKKTMHSKKLSELAAKDRERGEKLRSISRRKDDVLDLHRRTLERMERVLQKVQQLPGDEKLLQKVGHQWSTLLVIVEQTQL